MRVGWLPGLYSDGCFGRVGLLAATSLLLLSLSLPVEVVVYRPTVSCRWQVAHDVPDLFLEGAPVAFDLQVPDVSAVVARAPVVTMAFPFVRTRRQPAEGRVLQVEL